MVDEFKKRRDYIVEKLNSIPGISCIKPQGSFYVFPNISKLFGTELDGQVFEDSILLAQKILSKTNVAVVPGSAFGANDYFRFSYATSMENIIEGLNRIEDFIIKNV